MSLLRIFCGKWCNTIATSIYMFLKYGNCIAKSQSCIGPWIANRGHESVVGITKVSVEAARTPIKTVSVLQRPWESMWRPWDRVCRSREWSSRGREHACRSRDSVLRPSGCKWWADFLEHLNTACKKFAGFYKSPSDIMAVFEYNYYRNRTIDVAGRFRNPGIN